MGPPAFAGGNSDGGAQASGQGCRFNGATGFRRWKLLYRQRDTLYRRPLQWGHRLSPVETSDPHRGGRPRHRFNGATGFRRWKHDRLGSALNDTGELQWGHRLSPVETGNGCRLSA